MANAFTELLDRLLEKLRSLVPGLNTISDADLTAELDKLAEGTGLNWKESVVDFLKLIGVDSGRQSRDDVAEELGVDVTLKSGSAEKNEALRKALFKKIAENVGTIPSSLTD